MIEVLGSVQLFVKVYGWEWGQVGLCIAVLAVLGLFCLLNEKMVEKFDYLFIVY